MGAINEIKIEREGDREVETQRITTDTMEMESSRLYGKGV